MEYVYESDNSQQENSWRVRESTSYEPAKRSSQWTGMYIPKISVHIVQPQEFKDLVQRLTGAPEYHEESTRRTHPSPEPQTAPSYDYYSGDSENCEQQNWQSTPSYHQYGSLSTSVDYQEAETYYSTTYDPYMHSPYGKQTPSPRSPQPFDVTELPPLSPRDQIWANGWR